MGGEIWVDSSEGAGSGFGFTLTLQAVDRGEGDDIAAPSWMSRAFVIDHEGLNRTIIQKQLALMGLKPHLVSTVEELAHHRAGTRDLIFVEPSVLGGDPDALARSLRERFGPAALILLVKGAAGVPKKEPPFDKVLQRPVMRASLNTCLRAIPEPSVGASLPEAEILPSAMLVDVVPPPEPPLAETGPRLLRVLVAEDNRTNRFVIEKMLRTLRIDLSFAENGQEAVDHYQWQPPDLIFTDISMPKMDGKTAARRIRAIEAEQNLPRCPIVAITAHAMDGDADEILEAGIDHYLAKPVKKAALIDHILAVARDDMMHPIAEADLPEAASV